VTDTAQVELRSGRVYAPAATTASRMRARDMGHMKSGCATATASARRRFAISASTRLAGAVRRVAVVVRGERGGVTSTAGAGEKPW